MSSSNDDEGHHPASGTTDQRRAVGTKAHKPTNTTYNITTNPTNKDNTETILQNMPDKALARALAVLVVVLGTFLAVEAKMVIPDVSNIDIGLTDSDEAALFDRDHRGVAMNE